VVLPDVSVLVYAHREDAPDHEDYRDWLEGVVDGPNAYGISDLVLSGFVRLVTSPRVFRDPTPLERALAFARSVRERPHCVRIAPGTRHWEIFSTLLVEASARGTLATDAYLAALAIESGCDWITTDRDFARFPGLRWRHPLD
jgi:toxin-antitoxin system PIN domain toxin